MNTETIVISAVSGAVASLIGAPLGHWLATRRHISERWWEARAQAYSDVLLGLGRVKSALQGLYDECAEGLDDADVGIVKKCHEQWTVSAEEIAHIANQGTFKISPQADEMLSRFSLELRRPFEGDSKLGQWLLDTILMISVVIQAIGVEARRDLGVQGVRRRFTALIGERGRASKGSTAR